MIYSKKAIRQMLYQAYRAGERDGAACPAHADQHSLSLQNLRINELRKLYPALYTMRPDDARRRKPQPRAVDITKLTGKRHADALMDAAKAKLSEHRD